MLDDEEKHEWVGQPRFQFSSSIADTFKSFTIHFIVIKNLIGQSYLFNSFVKLM